MQVRPLRAPSRWPTMPGNSTCSQIAWKSAKQCTCVILSVVLLHCCRLEELEDANGTRLQGPWPAVGHNGTTVLDCAHPFYGVSAADGFWTGKVYRHCNGGILGPIEGFCTPLNCSASTDVIVDELGNELEGPFEFTIHGETANISCDDVGTPENVGPGPKDHLNDYYGLVTRACYAGQWQTVEGECRIEELLSPTESIQASLSTSAAIGGLWLFVVAYLSVTVVLDGAWWTGRSMTTKNGWKAQSFASATSVISIALLFALQDYAAFSRFEFVRDKASAVSTMASGFK